ncbi:MAG: ABC transporter permease [Gammaproteobacteria bacterium]|nr:ABC transporter permease [Gammaproteobacteria bacterium]NIM73565.1 ABC transporter permease [Gammaproteobacteria bacterium]NIN39974.1 ABC transporter permease [Gammaproteobacteria bacterium]NIO25374.1 ABC transporter permease [Gammaproteobacteria bacterium]NIO66001.1 ABC transporter permease [Gammaproteobacteria bacterium]
MEVFDQILQTGFFAALIRVATPLACATIGEMFSERAGVLNLGIEGIMLLGAMSGFTVAYFSGSLWLGMAAAAASGIVFAALMGLLTVTLGLSQHVSGLGVTMLCSGISFYCYRLIFGQPSQPPNVQPFESVALPGLAAIPFLGPVLFNHVVLVYLVFALVPLAAWLLYRTPWGLALRTVGENPQAAASAGVPVAWMRYQALMISGALFGIGGAYFSLAQFNAFTFGVISGRGWVCIALVVLGRWDPWRCALAALLFGAVDALQLRLQSSGAIDLPYQLFLMLPFLLTVVAMAMLSRNARAPASLLVPYRREER